MCLNSWDVLVILLCALLQAYVNGINSKIFCFLFGFVWTQCVLLFILTAVLGLFYSFERNSTAQRHYGLSSSSRVNRFNNFGSE